MTEEIKTKVCKQCKIKMKLPEFHKDKSIKKDGHRNICKNCCKVYTQEYYTNNKEVVLTSCRKRYKKDKELIYNRQKIYKSKNRERINKLNSKWKKANPGIVNANTNNRRLKQRTPGWVDKKAIRKIYIECDRITKETGIPHQVDHIIPLRGKTICGLHISENLRIIPAKENLAKHAKLIEELL